MDFKKQISFNYIDGTAIITVDGKFHQIEMNQSEAKELVRLIILYQSNEIPFEDIENLLDVEGKIEKDGWFLKNNCLYHESVIGFDGNPVAVPYSLASFIKRLVREEKDTKALINFWKRCNANPNKEAVNSLFTFIEHNNLTITPEGFVRGKKKVTMKNENCVPTEFEQKCLYLDRDGSTKSANDQKVSSELAEDFNRWIAEIELVASYDKKTPYIIGEPTVVDRSKVSCDPNISCGYGLHIGGDRYVNSFSGNIVISCLFDPSDVVAVPTGEEADKLRLAKLLTIGVDEVEPLGRTVLSSQKEVSSNIDILDWYKANYLDEGEDPVKEWIEENDYEEDYDDWAGFWEDEEEDEEYEW